MRKMVLLRWSVGAVGAGSVPGGTAGGARFSVLRLGEGYVPSRDYVGRGKVPVAGERGVKKAWDLLSDGVKAIFRTAESNLDALNTSALLAFVNARCKRG